jgi:glycosyltransferase involved in cell wall biosynthesis
MRILAISRYENAVRHRSEAEILIGLAKRGYEVTVLTVANSPLEPEFKKHGITVRVGHPTQKNKPSEIAAIRRLILDQGFDLLQLFNSTALFAGLRATKGLSIKIYTYRGAKGPYWHELPQYWGYFHPRVTGIVCVSEYVRKGILAQRVVPKSKVHTIHKGVNLDWFPHVPPVKWPFSTTERSIIVLTIGRFDPVKGNRYLVEAAKLLSDLQDVHVVFLGDGREREALRLRAKRFGNADRIHFLGHVDDVRPYLVAATVYVQPSLSEGLAKSVIEAMAYALPTVSTRSGGAEELLEHDRTGVLVPTRNAAALASSIRNLVESPDHAKQLGLAAKAWLAQHVNSEATAQKYHELYLSSFS